MDVRENGEAHQAGWETGGRERIKKCECIGSSKRLCFLCNGENDGKRLNVDFAGAPQPYRVASSDQRERG